MLTEPQRTPIGNDTAEPSEPLRVVYLSQKAPTWGGESFVVAEAAAMQRWGLCSIVLLPIRPLRSGTCPVPEGLQNRITLVPLIGVSTLGAALTYAFRRPRLLCRLIAQIMTESGSLRNLIVNSLSLPKGCWLALESRRKRWAHIHAHWLSATATVAWIASSLENIPFSITAHRWDIDASNMVRRKYSSAAFIRAIDVPGWQQLNDKIGAADSRRLKLLHMGVDVPEGSMRSGAPRRAERSHPILVPANFVPKKGHRYIIESLVLLPPECVVSFAGDGALEGSLRALAKELGVIDRVRFLGRIPHSVILDWYRSGDVGMVLLPSLVADDGQREGIPVALMEAMAASVPVATTLTGGTDELVDSKCGWILAERDSASIAQAVHEILMGEESEVTRRTDSARRHVATHFNEKLIATSLASLFAQSVPPASAP